MNTPEYLELSALQERIGDRIGTIEEWVRVEIESCRVSGGHYYLNLIEKRRDGEIAAKASGRIWRQRSAIVTEFIRVTGRTLEAGMEVVVLASVEYHPVYGLSLVIEDIDSAYSLGQREQERRRTIERLTEEGMMELQKGLGMPFLPSRIAVISSGDAAGYGDFVRHLEGNPYGFSFEYDLIQALMQGEKSPASIAAALVQAEESGQYDIAVILRGGGADSDLFGYDDYLLCRRVAECGIPVLTAVGHQRDFHVIDMVSYDNFKTPTALADFFIQWYLDVESGVAELSERIGDALKERIAGAERAAADCVSSISLAIMSMLGRLDAGVAALDTTIRNSDPRNVLRQGYVLAVDRQGRIIRKASDGEAGETFFVRFSDGLWNCSVNEVKLNTTSRNDK